jgi:hypothetical protein
MPPAVQTVELKASLYSETDNLYGAMTFDFDLPNGPLQLGKPTKFRAHFRTFEIDLPEGGKIRSKWLRVRWSESLKR